MSATNHTDPLNLSQFLGTDRPSWESDYNGDMAKIAAGHAALVAENNALQMQLTIMNNRITALATATGHGAI